jgi:hypothetical protein
VAFSSRKSHLAQSWSVYVNWRTALRPHLESNPFRFPTRLLDCQSDDRAITTTSAGCEAMKHNGDSLAQAFAPLIGGHARKKN